MDYEIRRVHLSVEKLGLQDINYWDEYTDVIVEMTDGKLFAASFFSYRNFEKILSRNQENGAFINGKYFWVEGMVFILNCKRDTVEEVIRYLIDEGDFESVFKLL